MTDHQGTFWDDGPPAQRHSPTSRAAAEAIEPHVDRLEAEVLAALRAAPDGLTDPEGQASLPMAGDTYRPRRVRLVEKGLVTDSGRKRRTTKGREAVVWIATSHTPPQSNNGA